MIKQVFPEVELKHAGIRDAGLLESAVKTCQQTFGGQDLYPDIFSKAACLFRSLIQNHAFNDGNKRTALVSLVIFLEENGHELSCDNKELVDFSVKVATHSYGGLDDIARWIKQRSTSWTGNQDSLQQILVELRRMCT